MVDQKIKILIVDDSEASRLMLKEILSDTYEIEQAKDGIEAITKLVNAAFKPNLLLLDVIMPGMDGFEVMSFIQSDPFLSKIPVIFITAIDQERQGLRAGAADYIPKPFDPEIVKLRVANQVELMLYRDNLEDMALQKTDELLAVKERFLDAFVDLIEYRSVESGHHVKHTKELARVLIGQLITTGTYRSELLGKNLDALVDAMSLHDIGKIGIPDEILFKQDRLSPEEFEIIKTHTGIGADVISSLMSGTDDDYLQFSYDICRCHHERWDGEGYPEKLAETQIPLCARIAAIVDVYEALVSDRCYKKAVPHEEAMEILRSEAGRQFDPEIIQILLTKHEQFEVCMDC